ncbi:Nif3-like dinuclear metal center hexameric protein [Mycoplasma phocoenae]|uniref:GTP cyclohydrolase 1 type 2 homolog n=1 Tax=Mycoplasma phocoenae TaxID=754517 RepID=A0A858U732_9MOLU|nr:Nif3-like dinuclear metal center hexameric protein [Mycoplasma phocoenae]QJG67075.1 hypothetical protein HGG69_01955 [Mycoplasma phocoenae]
MKTKNTTIYQFVNDIKKFFPIENAEKWDPIGFSKKPHWKTKINHVLFCLDITEKVVEFAIKNDCNLIISHHPFIFDKLEKDLENFPYKNNIWNKLNNNKIYSFSLHTSVDNTNNFSAKSISKKLGFLNNIDESYNKKFNTSSVLIKKEFTLLKLLKILNENQLDIIQTNIQNFDSLDKYKSLILFSGSGPCKEIVQAKKYADLFVTCDVKWSDWIAYDQENINVIQISHFSEHFVVNELKEIIQSNLSKYSDVKMYVFNNEIKVLN